MISTYTHAQCESHLLQLTGLGRSVFCRPVEVEALHRRSSVQGDLPNVELIS
jgi:hypothetical protein